jgi:hypothetical protein
VLAPLFIAVCKDIGDTREPKEREAMNFGNKKQRAIKWAQRWALGDGSNTHSQNSDAKRAPAM